MDKKEFEQLLDRRLNGESTPEENTFIDAVADRFYRQYKEQVFASDKDKERIYRELRKAVSPRRRWNTEFLKIAASVIVLIGVGVLSWYLVDNQSPQYTTGIGEERSITLDDNTQIQLNAVSTMSHNPNFGQSKRSLSLKGEAYFDVKKSEGMPFIVSINTTTVRVLGTSFNVNAYPEDSLVLVSLFEGRVEIDHRGKTFQLDPGQQFWCDQRSNETEIRGFDAPDVLAWQKKQLTFKRTSLQQVARIVKRNYGIDLHFDAPHLKEYTVSGKFAEPEISTLLDAVTHATRLEYRKTADSEYVIFQPKEK